MKTTPRKAIDFIENEVRIDVRFCSDEDVDKTIEVFKFAESALEKQIPKKPIEKAQTGFDFEVARSLVCPSCNAPIVNVWSKAKYQPKFCHYCGQALDWGDNNDEI